MIRRDQLSLSTGEIRARRGIVFTISIRERVRIGPAPAGNIKDVADMPAFNSRRTFPEGTQEGDRVLVRAMPRRARIAHVGCEACGHPRRIICASQHRAQLSNYLHV